MASSAAGMKKVFHWVPLAPPTAHGRKGLNDGAAIGALGVAAVGALMTFFNLGVTVWALVPLGLSAVLFGLPHGAIDHLVLLGLARRHLSLKNLIVVCGFYLAAVLLFLLLWWLLPRVALFLFLCYTVYHWGKSDLAFEAVRSAPPRGVVFNLAGRCHLLLRGLLPIGLPFVAFPVETERFLHRCLEAFGMRFELAGDLQLLFALCIGLLLLTELWFYYRKNHSGGIVLETLGLLVFFALVPPLLAIGLYFCGWHGLRHVLRLLNYYEPGREKPLQEKLSRSLARFFWRAAPFTVLSLLILWVVRLLVAPAADLYGTIAVYLILISALTLPHILVVEWMDRRELASD